MITNTTKKSVLLLSIISLNGSMFGMLDFNKIQQAISTRVLSQKRQVATAILVPLAVAGTFALAQHKDDISSLLEKIPMPSETFVKVVATAAAVPATYVLLGKFSPEEQFQLYHRNNTSFQEHPVMQHKELLKQFIDGGKEEKIQYNEREITLNNFITENFSDEVDKGLWPHIKISNELCVLERRMEFELQRLNRIDIVSKPVTIFQAKAQLNEDILFIKQLRGMIVESVAIKDYSAIKKNQLTAEKITFATKIAAFVPLFIQPVSLTCIVHPFVKTNFS